MCVFVWGFVKMQYQGIHRSTVRSFVRVCVQLPYQILHKNARHFSLWRHKDAVWRMHESLRASLFESLSALLCLKLRREDVLRFSVTIDPTHCSLLLKPSSRRRYKHCGKSRIQFLKLCDDAAWNCAGDLISKYSSQAVLVKLVQHPALDASLGSLQNLALTEIL